MAPDPQQGKLTEVDSTFSKLGNYTQLDSKYQRWPRWFYGTRQHWPILDPHRQDCWKRWGLVPDGNCDAGVDPSGTWLFMIILEYLNHENIYQNAIQLPFCETESSSNGSKLEKDTATHTWFEVEPARCCQPHHRNLRWLVWGWAAVEAPARFHQFHHDPLIHPLIHPLIRPLIHPIYPSVTSLYRLCGEKHNCAWNTRSHRFSRVCLVGADTALDHRRGVPWPQKNQQDLCILVWSCLVISTFWGIKSSCKYMNIIEPYWTCINHYTINQWYQQDRPNSRHFWSPRHSRPFFASGTNDAQLRAKALKAGFLARRSSLGIFWRWTDVINLRRSDT